MNGFCATRCHGNTGNGDAKDDSVVDHSWAPLQSQTKTGTETHPSNMAPTPSARFKNPANLPLSDWLTGAYPGSGNEVCATCHDPHGGNNAETDKQMIRMEWNDNTSTLCKECHV
jgi:predicted CXXCH cytochrome family protein